MMHEHTIAAIATPPGQGAISIIRVSGKDALQVCDLVFRPAGGKAMLSSVPAGTIHYGIIHENDEIIDEVLVSVFRAPRSYTGEDLVEISCHGSVYIQQKILRLLLGHGARPAGPGEFTRRAFLNGKMDLSQAEAVADLIASESSAFHRVAIRQMRGGFSYEIRELRNRLLEFISLVELELDFSDEDVRFADRGELQSLLDRIISMLEGLSDSFALGNALKNGIPVVIAGKPNTGKSTLLNLLLKEEKALVSEIPGTTRDSIEDVIHLEGMSFRFIDTAGIRETTDRVEIMGIERTMEKIGQAEIILFLAEATDTVEHMDFLLGTLRRRSEFKEKRVVLIINKADLLQRHSDQNDSGAALPGAGGEMQKENASRPGSGTGGAGQGELHFKKEQFGTLEDADRLIMISAKTGWGMEELKSLLVGMVREGKYPGNDIIVTNIRHYHALRNALEGALRASEGLKNHLPGDLLAMDIRDVLHYLGEITGAITTDEVLGNIFKNFCIGK
jgi:tRNA modification GTPase